MENINVSDLPEPVAQAIAKMVEELRRQLGKPEAATQHAGPVKLSLIDGAVIGTLSREEIYDERV
jgi:hypothetical protein